MKRLCLALCLVAAGCASQEHRDALTLYQSQCNAGNVQYCDAAAQQAEANDAEATQNGNIALGIIVLPLVPLMWLAGWFDDDDDEVDSFGHHHHHHHHPAHR
jgi:hypothetical protein